MEFKNKLEQKKKILEAKKKDIRENSKKDLISNIESDWDEAKRKRYNKLLYYATGGLVSGHCSAIALKSILLEKGKNLFTEEEYTYYYKKLELSKNIKVKTKN